MGSVLLVGMPHLCRSVSIELNERSGSSSLTFHSGIGLARRVILFILIVIVNVVIRAHGVPHPFPAPDFVHKTTVH